MSSKSERVAKKNLSMLGAVVHAFLGKEIAYYPRQEGVSVDVRRCCINLGVARRADVYTQRSGRRSC